MTRILFLGTPDFAVKPLEAILNSGENLIGVVCNQDKPIGRKQVLTPPPVKVFALSHGIPVYQYNKIRKEGVEDLKKLNPDLIITCAFGQILSQEILDIPKMGVFNIHASLLPKYRGASPINYAILCGEKTTGITIMKTDAGIDTGDILFQEKVDINEKENCGELFNKLSELGAKMIKDALPKIISGNYTPIRQDEKVATYTKMIEKTDAIIDWNDSAVNIFNKIRAFNPSPVAYTFWGGEPFKVFEAEISDRVYKAGEIFCENGRLYVGTLDKAISLLKVQKAGGKQLLIGDFLRGNSIPNGTVFSK